MLTVLVGLAANALVAVLKSIVAVVTGSASMVAEAAHSWADTGNEVFLFIAERRAKKPADTLHPLGYGREAYVWSMIAAFGLFTVGSAVSILHGVQSLSALETEASHGWAYAVLGAAFVLEGISFTQARRETVAGARQAQMSRFEFLESTSNPTLRAVYFEDAAALVGLVIAGLGMWLHQITGNPVYDAIGSILVGVLLGVVAIWLIARNMAFLNGQVADGRPYEAALRWLLARPEVAAVTFLHLEYVGPGTVFVIGSVDLEGDDSESQAARELQQLEDDLRTHPNVAFAVMSLAAPGVAPLLPESEVPGPGVGD